jgi:hypothetical protein
MIIGKDFKRYAMKGDYMPVENCHCLNLVTAVIDYYKRQPPPYRLKTILLDSKHWHLFIDDLRRIDKDYPIDAQAGVQLEGCDVTVKKGSKFQTRELVYEFYPMEIKGTA